MSKRIIELNDTYSKTMKDKVSVTSGSPRGEVSIFEKKNGKLGKLLHKSNMIVFSGRSWLLRKAFGTSLDGNDSNIYNKEIRWFGCGNGGGEPGNPLQAGPTLGQDTDLYQAVRMRSDLTISDPGYSMYASDYSGNHGYYKKFSSVIVREDHANPYTIDNVTSYPPLIAEIRIELSSDDSNSGAYEDLNEAALFLADPNVVDPGAEAAQGGVEVGVGNVIKVTQDSDYAIYYLESDDIATDIPGFAIGDYVWVNNAAVPLDPNNILESGQQMIVDMYNGDPGVRKGYIVVEKPGVSDTDYIPTYPVAHFVTKSITPYIMFSRVTFSTIRKTVDREIVFLWKIYF